MSDYQDLTPEEHLQAAFDHLSRAARLWAGEARQAIEPYLRRLSDLASDPQMQARQRRRAADDVAAACDCECAALHAGSWVCDMKAVTTIRRSVPSGGGVDVPVCAPCAAEVMAQQR